jgi:hypothetical protein
MSSAPSKPSGRADTDDPSSPKLSTGVCAAVPLPVPLPVPPHTRSLHASRGGGEATAPAAAAAGSANVSTWAPGEWEGAAGVAGALLAWSPPSIG